MEMLQYVVMQVSRIYLMLFKIAFYNGYAIGYARFPLFGLVGNYILPSISPKNSREQNCVLESAIYIEKPIPFLYFHRESTFSDADEFVKLR